MNSKELVKALRKGEITIADYKKLLENKSKAPASVSKEQSILAALNESSKPFPTEKCIHHLFEDIAKQYPQQTALKYEEESMSYEDLRQKSNALAHAIQKQEIVPGDIIGIYMDRSIETIIAILGILKAGAAFLPLDVNYPDSRIAYIIQNSQLKIVLTKKVFQEKLVRVQEKMEAILLLEEVAAIAAPNLRQTVTAKDLAYIIYTSGTTGHPKGVMLQHNAFVSMITDQIQRFSGTPQDRYAQFASISFDASVSEIFLALLSGGTLVIIPEHLKKNGALLLDYFIEKGITIATLPPTLLATIPKEKPLPLKTLITAGEAARIEEVKHYSQYLTYINAYGPTESTVCSSSFTVDPNSIAQDIPIGTPLSNIQFHILDAQLQEVKVGVPGELYLSGMGLARGYLNNPALTQERFPMIKGLRTYKTGDRVICKRDGQVYFLGRTDHQIKIRGFRVDPQEIEIVLQEQEQIKSATIVAKKVHQDLSLIAYYTAEGEIKNQPLKSFLESRVPSYMIPHFFIPLAEMPLTVNGKIDREQLLQKELSLNLDNQYVAAQNETEKELVAIWEDILGIDEVGVEDNFFELGGDSIKNIQVINKASKYGLDLKNADLFKYQTIQELSKNVDLSKIKNPDKQEAAAAATLSPAAIDTFLATNQLLQQKDNIEAVFSLTSLQLGILYEHIKTTNSDLYYLQSVITIEEKINYPLFEETINELIARYDALRTGVFYQNIAEPLQVTFKNCKPSIEILDWRNTENKAEKLQAIITSRRRQNFDLSNPPLLRICFIEYEDTKVKLLVESHHILMDGWSNGILLKYIFNAYSNKVYQTPFSPGTPILYRDYVAQLTRIKNPSQEKTFWEAHLKGFEEITPFPLENLENKILQKNAEIRKETKYYNDLTNASEFIAFSQKKRITPNTITLAALFILLKKLSNKNDILIGGISSGRSLRGIDTKDSVGLHVNTTPFRVSLEDTDYVDDFLTSLQETSLQRLEYEHTSMADIYSYCDYKSSEGLFQILYGFQNFPKYQVDNQDSKINISKLETIEQDHYPLGFAFSFSDTLEVIVNYDTNRYSEKTIDTLIYYFKNIIAFLLMEEEKVTIAKLPILQEKDLQTILYDWNSTDAPIPNFCIHEMVEQHALQNPTALAVQDAKQSISYQDLLAKSNQVANHLHAQKISKGDAVAVYLERSAEVIIAILGIMKAGAVYVPLVAAAPEKRVAYILENAQVKAIITQSHLAAGIKSLTKNAEPILRIHIDAIKGSTANPTAPVLPSDRAYIIYTSGSTGLPKGVPITHRSFVNMMVDKVKIFAIQSTDVVSQIASLSFDASISEMFMALFSGAKLMIIPEDIRKSGTDLISYLTKHRVTVSTLTPSYISVLDKKQKLPLRTLISGGEKAKTEDVVHYSQYLNFFNGYGPTEIAICASCYQIDPENIAQNIPIGKPIANTKFYVLDQHKNPQPIGVKGELYIGGVGLTSGYLGREELNQKVFIKSPFNDSERLYKTGDIVKWMPDGNLVFSERIDFQVKIRGHRIELGEIENTLLKFPGLKENAVIHKTSDGDSFLVCFYSTEKNRALDALVLRKFLKSYLPDYMIPAKFIPLESLPMTINGKLDLKQLKARQISFTSAKEIIEPANETEKKLAEIWKSALKIKRLSTHDNFYELGGDSIKTMKILGQIQHEFGQKIDINVFSENASVALLAKVLLAPKGEDKQQIQAVPFAEYYPVSNTQLRFWMQYQMGQKIVANSIRLYTLKEAINPQIFESAIRLSIQRHEILRTAIIEVDQTPKQKILPADAFEFALEVQDLSALEDWKAAAIGLANKAYSTPFDLTAAPLIRGQLLKIEAEKYVFILSLHHSIVDGWSTKILFEEIQDHYQKLQEEATYQPSPLRIHYKDYSVWLASQLSGNLGSQALDFWKKQYPNGVKDFHFPTDYPRKKEKTTSGQRIAVTLPAHKFAKLKELAEVENVSLYMVLISLLKVSLARQINSNEITVRTPVHGRFHLDLQHQIGPYINSIPVHTQLRDGQTFRELLKATKEFMLQVFNYQFYPIDQLASDLNVKRYYDRMPFSDVVIVMQNKGMAESSLQENEDLSTADLSNSGIISMVDLRIELNELEDSLLIALDYNSDLFKANTIQEIAHTILLLTDEVLANPGIEMKALKKDNSNQEVKKSFDFDLF